MSDNDLMSLLYQAQAHPRGIVIESDDVERVRQKLYALMRDNEIFSSLSLIPSPLNPRELLIIQKEQPQ